MRWSRVRPGSLIVPIPAPALALRSISGRRRLSKNRRKSSTRRQGVGKRSAGGEIPLSYQSDGAGRGRGSANPCPRRVNRFSTKAADHHESETRPAASPDDRIPAPRPHVGPRPRPRPRPRAGSPRPSRSPAPRRRWRSPCAACRTAMPPTAAARSARGPPGPAVRLVESFRDDFDGFDLASRPVDAALRPQCATATGARAPSSPTTSCRSTSIPAIAGTGRQPLGLDPFTAGDGVLGLVARPRRRRALPAPAAACPTSRG